MAGKSKSKLTGAQKDKRIRLIESGASAFATKGVGGARIAEIAKNAEVAAGTFYLYFKDKEQLFEEVMTVGTEQIIAKLTNTIDGEDVKNLSNQKRNELAMGKVVDFAVENKDLFRLLMSRGGAENPLQRSLVDMIATVRIDQLQTGQKSGRFLPNLDPEITARGEIGFAYHVLDWWLSNPKKATREEVIKSLVAVRMFGVETNRDL